MRSEFQMPPFASNLPNLRTKKLPPQLHRDKHSASRDSNGVDGAAGAAAGAAEAAPVVRGRVAAAVQADREGAAWAGAGEVDHRATRAPFTLWNRITQMHLHRS